MNPKLTGAACLAVWCLSGGVALAADGIVISQRMTIDGKAQTSQVQITSDKMRAEIPDLMGQGGQAVIFDGTRQVMNIVNMQRKTYVEVTKEQIDQMAAQMQSMMGQMQAAMANMPPAQRAQMEAMMRGRGMGNMAAPAKIEYRKTGTDRVGQWTCDTYEGTQNGQKVSELCTVAPATVGLSAADMQTMQQLSEFFKKLVPQGGMTIEVGRPEDQGFSGIPVRTAVTVGDKKFMTEVTGFSKQNIADTAFQVPAGFQKQSFPMGAGR